MEVRLQAMARDWYGPIERFGDAFKARRKLWVLCKECGHTALADPRDLLVRLGDITLERAGRKLRCKRCHRANAHFVPQDQPWSSLR
jgi:hypothetical protein